ncbi:MAG: ABC transporter substrate-binding protein [Candidatus Thorarchaeota archaeon]
MKISKKMLFALLVLTAFSTFLWSTSSTVVASIVQSGPKPDAYWIENQGYVDQIIYKVITQEELMVEALRTGEIDISGSFVNVALLKPSDYNNPDLGITETRRRGFGHMTFNTQKFPTNVRAFRQGFAYGLDKQKVSEQALAGASFTADSPIIASLGIWSCEYQYAQTPCSPTGDTYYSARPDKGNTTLVNAGFFDQNSDGFRQFYNGTLTGASGEGLVWDGAAVSQSATTSTTNGYPDPNWDGYTYKGADGVRRTFSQANQVAGGQLLGAGDSGTSKLASAAKTGTNWIPIQFTITGSAGSQTVTDVVTIASEGFYSVGLHINTEYITFASLINKAISGDFYAVFFAWSLGSVDPTFLSLFQSTGVNNEQFQRFQNSTFDADWLVVQDSSNFNDVLQASMNAQQILWQEQPLVVMYNNQYTSVFRTDKFEGFVTEPGRGAGVWISGVHLKNTYENWQQYPDYPLGGTLVYGLSQPIATRNSMSPNGNDAYTQQTLSLVEDGLFTRNPETLDFMNSSLAYNWTTVAPYTDPDLNNCPGRCIIDGSKFTFNLLDGVTWQDGTPFTPEDVKFSFDTLISNQSVPYYDGLVNVWPERITTTAHSITIYSNSSGLFEFPNMGIGIYEKARWNMKDPTTWDNPNPIGTGPYKWTSSVAGEYYLQTRYDGYYYTPTKTTFLHWFTSPTSPTTTSSSQTSTTTTTSGGGPSPGFEVIATAIGIATLSIVVIKRRRNPPDT